MKNYFKFIKSCKRDSNVNLKRSYITYYLLMVVGITFIGLAFIPCDIWWYIDYTVLVGVTFFLSGISMLNHEYLHAYAHYINGGFEGDISIRLGKCFCLNKKDHSYTYKQMKFVLMLPLYVNVIIGVLIAIINMTFNYLIRMNIGMLEQWNPFYTMLFPIISMLLLSTCSIGDFELLYHARKESKKSTYIKEIGIPVEGKEVPKFKIIGKEEKTN